MSIQVDDKEFELMLEYDQIKKRTRLIGIQINLDYEKRVPVFLGVLTGSFIFMADLIKEIHIASEVSFIKVSSYQGESSTGIVKEVLGLNMGLKGRDVIIVEDIIDTGLTLNFILETIQKRNPASITVCSLLLKPKSLQKEFSEITYIGFEIPDDFVVGYGLDYNGLGRNLKDIYKAVQIPSET